MEETSLVTEALKGLIASGPLAILLAYAVVKLWTTWRTDLAEKDKAIQERCPCAELEAARAQIKTLSEKVDRLHNEKDEIRQEFVDVFKGIAQAARSKEGPGG